MKFIDLIGKLRKLFKLDKPLGVSIPQDWRPGATFAMEAASWYHAQLQYITNRRQAYRDYEEMENYGIIHSALNLYAEEATQPDFASKKIIWVEHCKNQKVLDIANELFERLDIQSKAYSYIRAIAKYGDCFVQLLYDMNEGIVGWKYTSPELVSRVEDNVGRLIGFAPGIVEITDMENLPPNLAKPWDFIHFRLQSIKPDNIHGDSLLFGARMTWRQLKLLEDIMIYYRILRAPDRWVYLVEVGDQTPVQAWQTLEQFRKAVRFREFKTNEVIGQYRTEFIPISWVDDFFWIMRNGVPQVKVEKFEGKPSPMQDISDVEFFRNKLFSDLRIPKAALGFEGEINARATLLQQDVRFARTIKALRQVFVTGIAQLLQLQLSFKGIDPLLPENHFTVAMAPVSYLDEIQKSELFNMKAGIAQTLVTLGKDMNLNKKEWFSFVLSYVLNLSPKEIEMVLPKEFEPEVGVPGLPPVPPMEIPPAVKPLEKPPEAKPVGEKPPEETPPEVSSRLRPFQGKEQLTGFEKELLEKIVNHNHYDKVIKNIYQSMRSEISSSEVKAPITNLLYEELQKDKSQFTEENFLKIHKLLEEVANKYKQEDMEYQKQRKEFLEQMFKR